MSVCSRPKRRGGGARLRALAWTLAGSRAPEGLGNMGWASGHIARLQAGDTVHFRPRGSSMQGKIDSGQLCTVEPVDTTSLQVGDIVLCKVNGRQYLHL